MMFWLYITLLTLFAISFVLFPLLRQNKNNAPESNALNIAIHKKRMAELETEFEKGNLDETRYNSACEEIERDLLTDIKNNPTESVVETGSSRVLAIITGITLPVLTIGLYLILGSWHNMDENQKAGIKVAATNEQQTNMPGVDEMIQSLVDRLEQEPDDPDGWRLLGRSYLHVKRFSEARQAFDKAIELTNPPTASLLTDYAEVLALSNNSMFTGRSSEFLTRALKIDPQYPKAIWLSGFARFQEEKFLEAIKHWQYLKALLPPDSPDHESLNNYIAKATEQSGITVTNDQNPAVPKIQIKVNVDLDDALINKVSSDDVVFVYAYAAKGPRMPLAIVRKKADELPLTVTLDETMAMTPQMSLVNFSEIIINARISKSGQATPQPGDLIGKSDVLKTTEASVVDIIINHINE
jgi:cytochrome c-type biogenesis protein CcmH